MEIKLLVDRFNNADDLEELKAEWLFELLVHLGAEEEVLEDSDAAELFDYFYDNHIDIVEYPSIGGVSIMYKDDLVGEWGGPEFKMIRDKKTGELYYEVTIECWSIMDEEAEN